MDKDGRSHQEYETNRQNSKLGMVSTCIMIFKSTVGVGIFTMQYAYSLCGFGLGTAIGGLVLYMIVYGIDTTLYLSEKIEEEEERQGDIIPVNIDNESGNEDRIGGGGGREDNNFSVQYELLPGTKYQIVTYHQIPNRLKGKDRAFVTLISIISSVGLNLGFGLGNYVYLIKAIKELGIFEVSEAFCSTCIFIILAVLLALIIEPEKIKYLAFGILGMIFASSFILLFNNLWDSTVSASDLQYNYVQMEGTGIMVGVTLFSFESIVTIVNVRRTTKHPERMRWYCRLTFGAASVFYLLLCASFHLAYGNTNLKKVGFDYFKQSAPWIYYLKFVVGLNPLFAVPFATITVIEMFEKIKPLSKLVRTESGSLSRPRIFLLRLILLTGIYLCTLLSADIDTVFDIVGSVFGPVLGFLIPVYVYHRWVEGSVPWWRRFHDTMYVLVSCVLSYSGIVYTMHDR